MVSTHDDEITKASLSIPLCSTSNHDILQTEDEIERHLKIIIDLKIRRNGYLAINKLPVEILCRVFHFVQAAWTEYSVSNYHHTGPTQKDFTWIAVARVCHHWRNAALHDPSLWTRPYLQYPKWTAFMLERSRMAGLRLFFDYKSCVHEEAVSAIVPHIPRTVEVTIQAMRSPEIRQLLESFQFTEAPMLQQLVIKATSPSQSWRSTIDNDNPPRLHDNSFLNAGKLFRLSLGIVDISWTSHLLASSLTHLHINTLSNRARPTPSEFVTVLERLTRLKALNLTNALPLRDSILRNPLSTPKRIILRELEELSVESEVSECQFLWKNITTSNNLKDISACVTYVAESTLSLPGFLEAVYTADVSNHLALNSRMVYFSGDGRAARPPYKDSCAFSIHMVEEIARSYDAIHVPIISAASPCSFSLHVKYPSTPSMYTNAPFDAVFLDLCAGVRWNTLSGLSLTHLFAESSPTLELTQALARTFGALPGLRLVVVGDIYAKPLVDALLLNTDEDPVDAPQSVVFPGLRYIVLRGVFFGWGGYPNITMKHLRDCVMNRYERGAEIYSISIENGGNIDEKDIALLQEIVVDVKWDGLGGRESEDHDGRRWY